MIANGHACLHELLRKTPMKYWNSVWSMYVCIDVFFPPSTCMTISVSDASHNYIFEFFSSTSPLKDMHFTFQPQWSAPPSRNTTACMIPISRPTSTTLWWKESWLKMVSLQKSWGWFAHWRNTMLTAISLRGSSRNNGNKRRKKTKGRGGWVRFIYCVSI